MKAKSIFIVILLTFIGFSSCDKQNPVDEIIPYADVDISINPASIKYGNLNIDGNYAYVFGGYRGIIIYHLAFDQYFAFERTSPYDYPNDFECRVNVDESRLYAVDPCSGSKYILWDGSGIPFEGPATLPLKRYNTHFDGSILHIWN